MKYRLKGSVAASQPVKFTPSLDVVVGIDASLTGFGLCSFGVSTKTGEIEHQLWRYTSKLKGVERLGDIRDWFTERLCYEVAAQGDLAHVSMEGYAWGSRFNREVMGELGGVVKLALLDHCTQRLSRAVPTALVPPPTLKKFTAGSGNAKKEQMIMAVYKKWGVDTNSNDEADAYSLARVSAAIVGLTEPAFDYEREVIAKLTGQGNRAGNRTTRRS